MGPPTVARPALSRFTLGNGLRVVLAPAPSSPTVSVWVWYRVGSKNEWPGVTGASHWVEHMLFAGSPRYGKGDIDRAVVRVGGQLNAFTSTDQTAYFITVPREHLSVPLDIESDRMVRALLTDREVDRERTVIHSEREGAENFPEFRVEEELYQLAFRHHPYRWSVLGSREDIEQLSPATLRSYYQRFYGPRNAVLVVAGGFAPGPVAREIRRRFGPLPSTGDDVTVDTKEPPARGERSSAITGPGTTPLVEVGWRTPALGEPGTAELIVLDAVLGGETGFFTVGASWRRTSEHPSSRLYRGLVDPGIAVRASSDWRYGVCPGLFVVRAHAAAQVPVERLEEKLLATVDQLVRTGPTRAEIEEVRTKVRRGADLAYEGASRTGFRLGYFSSVRDVGYEDELFRSILRVTPAGARAAARSLFRPESRAIVRYLPTSEAADE